MTEFIKSNEATEVQPEADEGIYTAHIDVNSPDELWIGRIQVHGMSVEDADTLRDEVLAALELLATIKKAIKL